jgi:hypothetical protein
LVCFRGGMTLLPGVEVVAALGRRLFLRHGIEAVVDRFTDMQTDHDRGCKAKMRLWAGRQEQIYGGAAWTEGRYGDLKTSEVRNRWGGEAETDSITPDRALTGC